MDKLRVLSLLLTITLLCNYTSSAQCPQNIDFEYGNFTNWTLSSGTCCPINTPSTGVINGRHVITSGTATDAYGGFPIVAPGSGSYSLKLGNLGTGAKAERATYKLHVPNNMNNYSLIFRYAVVFQDPGHQPSDQPRFEVKAYDSATNAIINCSQFTYIATSNLPGFSQSSVSFGVWYKPWTTASLDLSGYAGQTVYIDFANGDCDLGAHFGYGYVDLNCSLFQISYDACDTNSTVTLTAPPGFNSYTWIDTAASWTTVDTGQTVTITKPSATTTYAVVLSPYTGFGCPDTLYSTVAINNLTINATADTIACAGDSIQLTAGATANANPITYSWSPNSFLNCDTCASPIATPTSNITYYVTATDANGCSEYDTVTIQVSNISVSATAQDVLCNGDSSGSVTAIASGGLSPYTYSWNTTPGSSTATVNNLSAGTYIITAVDTLGCTDIDTTTINQPSAINSSVNTSDVSCNGGSNGTAIVTTTGGTTPYTYSWSTTPTQTSDTATGLTAGTYIVTVTDSNGCTAIDSAQITEPNALSLTISAKANITCNGGSNGMAVVSASGGTTPYIYSWNTTPVQTDDTATGLSAGTYTVTVTDSNGCTDTAIVTISQPSILTASINATNSVSCHNDSNGIVVAIGTGGTAPYTYSWNTIPTNTNDTLTGLTAGTYTVTIIDSNGCSDTATTSIAQPTQLIAAITGQTNVLCNGNNIGTATVTANGGTTPYSYRWNTTPTQSTATATGLYAGGYVVTVTDTNGCTDTAAVTITQPGNLVASIASSTDVSCYGGSNGTATVSGIGGTTPYTYTWNTTPIQTNSTATGLSAGTYIVTITDSVGCTGNDTVTIDQPDSLVATITSAANVLCNGEDNGSATATATGGTTPYTYSWNTIPTQTNATATNLSAGTYTVIVTDGKNCEDTASVNITEPSVIDASIISSNKVLCNGGNNGSATAAANGGTAPYSYSWNTVPTQTNATAVNLTAGTYIVIVTDTNGCTDTASVIISEPTTLNTAISNTTSVDCYGGDNGTATAIATGGTTPYSYSWNTVPAQTTTTATNLTAGIYKVTITDSNGCTDTASTQVTQPNVLNASITKDDVSCNGGNNGSATAGITGGTAPYTYSWSTTPTQNTPTVTGLSAGTYTLTVLDTNGCTDTASVTILQSSSLNTTTTATDVLCNGDSNGTASINVSGGTAPYTYNWNTSPTQTTATATGLSTGSYTVVVLDSNGCGDTASVTIGQPNALNASISSLSDVSCYNGADGTATATAIGGTTPYTYSWNTTPAQTNATATGLSASIYTVTVTDSNGCTDTATATINQPNAITTSITKTDVSCNGGSNGTATTLASGGTAPYTYSWNTTPTQTGATGTNLSVGTYTVTIQDSNGCNHMSSITITEPNALSSTVNTIKVKCFGDTNGRASVVVNGGTAPYTYSWNTTPIQTNATATNLSIGTYTVYITDSNGCKDTAIGNVAQPNTLTAFITAKQDVKCHDGEDGSATADVTGGTAPYTYSWNTTPIQNTPAITGLNAGNYTVSIVDSNGCADSASTTISQPEEIKAVATPTNKTCIGVADGGAKVDSIIGGIPPYTFSWNTTPTQTTSAVSGLLPGTYNVVITDSKGCDVIKAVTISNYAPITLSLEPYQILCEDEQVQLLVSGAHTYQWIKDTAGLSCANCNNPVAKPSDSKTYYVLGIDTNNCTDTTEVFVEVLKRGATSVGPDLDVCLNEDIALSASGGVEYTWLPNEWLNNNKISNPISYAEKSMQYIVIIKQNECYTDTLQQNVNVHPLPTVELGSDITGGIAGASFQLHAEATLANKIEWSPSLGLSCYDCFDPIARTTGQKTTYVATVTTEYGCIAQDNITIETGCDGSVLTMPNTFTPNGDGLNDRFWPITRGTLEVERMSIYSRWGEKIFEATNFLSNDANYGWDGTYKNAQLSPDVYVYIIELSCASGQMIRIKGDISLIR